MDSDSDGLPDAFETFYFQSLVQTAAGDPDGDTLPNSLELASNRNPNLAETVAGVPDWQGVPGALRMERWNGISGTQLGALFSAAQFPASPDERGFVTRGELQANAGDNYGVRLQGTLTAPVTGSYRFYLSADNTAELWLGTSASKFTRRRVASVPSYTSPGQWTTYPEQASVEIRLVAGEKYHIESLMKESTSNDHLAIAWTYTPDDSGLVGVATPVVIPGTLSDPAATVVLTSYVPDPEDADDDGLLDSAELAMGLSPGDNGSINSGDDAYSDPDGDGMTNFMEWVSGGDPFTAGGNPGYVQREIWRGLSGTRVSDLTSTAAFPKPASSSDFVSSALSFSSIGDNYGQRIRGMIIPPRPGNWRFWIAGDNACELWLSNNQQPSGKRKVAYVATYTSPEAYDTTPSQKSQVSYQLEAVQPRYFEILHKESSGGDHVSVAWAFEPTNWARVAGTTATQSSTYGGQDASRAIDGNTSGATSANTMSHTNTGTSSWWQAEFAQVCPVNRVVLFNRTDAIQNQQRLSNFRVSVLDANGVELKGQNFCTTSGQYVNGSLTWDIGETLQAKKIKVQFLGYNLMGNGYLCLAEVQAFEWVPEANRHVIPASALLTAVPDPADTDGDSLPDAFEIQYGLDPNDNGASVQTQGEYGNPDGDQDSNFIEFINQTAPNAPNGIPGSLQRDTWWNLGGYTLVDLLRSAAYLEYPTTRDTIQAWQSGSRGDYFGQRLRGLYQANATGWHTFWIAGDDACTLYFNDGSLAQKINPNDPDDHRDEWNTSSRKFGKQAIATIGGENYYFGNPPHTPAGDYDKYPSQKSRTVWLIQNTSYYLEVLHKGGEGLDHVSVAVQPLGGTRANVDFNRLTSFVYDEDDDDDDDLPDHWESQYGLDPADNGRINPGIDGALGDADGDQLTNREEYLLGTDPMDADSDNDTLSDFVEVKSIGSNPTSGSSGLGAVLTNLTGSSGTAASGQWIAGPNGSLVSLDRRGSATWDFTLASSGWHLLEVLATPQGNTWAGAPLTVEITVTRPLDNKKWTIGTFPLRDDEGQPTRILALLPSMPAGDYRANIALKNISESRNVRIDGLRVIAPVGTDANNNGIPDWIETRLGQENGVLSATTSPVSPACVEGIARDVAKSWLTANGQNIALEKGVNNRWFANLPLPADGTAQTLNGSFEDASLVQPHAVAWTATNLLDSPALTIRSGDALRLTAHPGATADNGTVSVGITATTLPSSYSGYLSTSSAAPTVAWANHSLESVTGATGIIQGAWQGIPALANSYHLSATADSASFQLQFYEGTYTKVVKVQLNRTAGGINAHQVYAKYATGNLLGQDFDVIASSPSYSGSGGYGIVSVSLAGNIPIATLAGFPATTPVVRDFATGTYTLTATHTAADNTATTATVNVRVVKPDFGTALPVRSDRWREWTLHPSIEADLPLEWDSRLTVEELAAQNGSRRLKVAATGDQPVHILARTAVASSVAAKGTVDPYLIGDPYDTGLVEILETLPDGTLHGRVSVVADRLPPGGYVEIQIWAGGAQFGNGTGVRKLYAADFDANGVALVDVYYQSQAAISSFCAYYRLYDGSGKLLSGY